MMNELTYKEVWKTLSGVNVDELKQQKGNLDYLGWSKAWSILMDHYAYATYEFEPETFLDNGTAMCHCHLRIGNLERYMWLAVMDYNNKSIKNPTYQQIQNTRMRTLVKAISMFGLGFYIYEGAKSFPYADEDLPNETKDLEEASVTKENYAYVFTKTGGEEIGSNDPLDFLHQIKHSLNQPNNVLHKKLFKENFDAINFAAQYADEDTKLRYDKMIGLYAVTETNDDSSS